MTEEIKPHRRGRPALRTGEISTPVNVRLTAQEYDAASARARLERTSLPAVVRRALREYLTSSKVG